ncbi:hypothetical protein CNMCM8980_002377 [Aspergillus fumigatiaffinis]|nr:hypothetical protein CNMCM8980_002377 [Aspergillus fumigatiaffinis]
MSGAPEGEAWFFHDAITFGTFNPRDPKQFYTTIFLEVVTNYTLAEEAFRGRGPRQPRAPWEHAQEPKLAWEGHPRAGKQVFSASMRASYARYKFLPVMTGPSILNITDVQMIHGSFDYNTLHSRTDEQRIAFVPVKVPSLDERFLWVDMTYPLRGIYIPKLHIAHPEYQNMCRYTRLDFRAKDVKLRTYKRDTTDLDPVTGMPRLAMGGVASGPPSIPLSNTSGGETSKGDQSTQNWEKMTPEKRDSEIQKLIDAGKTANRERDAKRIKEPGVPEKERARQSKELSFMAPPSFSQGELKLPADRTMGWDFHPKWTVRFDILKLAHLFALHRDLMDSKFYHNPYQFVALFDCTDIPIYTRDAEADSTMNPGEVMDLAESRSKQDGAKYKYADNGFDPNWMIKCFVGIAAAAASCIPMVGPLAALSISVAAEAIMNPQQFATKQGLASQGGNIVSAFIGSAQNVRSFTKSAGAITSSRPNAVVSLRGGGGDEFDSAEEYPGDSESDNYVHRGKQAGNACSSMEDDVTKEKAEENDGDEGDNEEEGEKGESGKEEGDEEEDEEEESDKEEGDGEEGDEEEDEEEESNKEEGVKEGGNEEEEEEEEGDEEEDEENHQKLGDSHGREKALDIFHLTKEDIAEEVPEDIDQIMIQYLYY